ncbi:regulator of G-protein signaling 9-binding protein [Labrus bergylta]|uniref:Regulator of G protein signaling 9 binding protein n=1 Tax=Labrus bergylta TaxID=56723 RepID=A0A3Q3H1Q8_9LABR|nr:regulator of G-protein signaling 9-binding protein B-like [Labrus bergylta]
MPLINNKVSDGCTVGTEKALADGKALVDSLVKVVACYRHLASCVGSCTDSLQLRDELRQTREKAQKLAVDICSHLTSHLRNKSLPEEQRKEMELLWVAFSSSLELLHLDMCKVLNMGDTFCLADAKTLVKTGLQGGGSEVCARALSLPDLNQAQTSSLPTGLEVQERGSMEKEISQIDNMIEDMEMKVNVLRWMVEPRGPKHVEQLSGSDSTSLALTSIDEEQQEERRPLCQRSPVFVVLLLLLVVLVAASLSVSIVFFS